MEQASNQADGAGHSRAFKEGEPCIRVHIWLYADDIAWVDAQCAGGWDNASTRSKFIRLALRRMVRAIQAKADAAAHSVHIDEVSKR